MMKPFKIRLFNLVSLHAAVISILFSFSVFAAPAEVVQHPHSDTIKKILSSAKPLEGETLHVREALHSFYNQNEWAPAWGLNGGKNKQVKEFVRYIESIEAEGLDPELYHSRKISILYKKVESNKGFSESNIHLDLLLTDAYLSLSSTLDDGLFDVDSRRLKWIQNDQKHFDRLQEALKNKNFTESLDSLIVRNTLYNGLKKNLQKYQKISEEGGWPLVFKGTKLEAGVENASVIFLKRRLLAEGYIDAKNKKSSLYDDEVVDAVKKFQSRHGLEQDGKVGPQTLAVLNVTAKDRVCQIKINMDRARALSDTLVNNHIWVNIPEFMLHVMEGGEEVMTMKVIAGRKDRRTPLMHHNIRYLVFSPAWHVPHSIAVKDKLPELIKDSSFLVRNNMRLMQEGEGGTLHDVDATTVDWTTVSTEDFPYRITQMPGDGNALGRVKFMFPNKDNVYLHDTSQPELFAKYPRAFSSGCIRIEQPAKLAEYVLRDRGTWNKETISAAMNRASEQIASLPQSMPIHLVYLTAFGLSDGGVGFRDDVYGYDRAYLPVLCGKKGE